ncbi:MAG: DUF3857 domain-containing protein, partial [Candidatus Omnitrophica bacterium]|nr:DUF3857 domain-containing protein [Candidatus Omnitrophota bacterium]
MNNYKLKIIKQAAFYALTSCVMLSGCGQRTDLDKARDYFRQSQEYYQRAVSQYKNLAREGKGLETVSFELGRLYYNHGEFKLAAEEFSKIASPEAKKYLAISYYKLGDFTDALTAFNSRELADGEYLYYFGLTCERLNLYDKALEVYAKIKDKEYEGLAAERSNIIEKQVSALNIKDVSPQVSGIIANAPEAEQYPQAGALILSCDENIKITPENTQVSDLHYVVKILNERGKESFSETHIDYDSTYEKIDLEYARTIKPDGSVVEVGSRHIRDVSKYLNFPLYSNARVYIISFPEITEGACIEYKLKIYRSQLINKKEFVLNYEVQSQEPVISANFGIQMPKGRKLFIKKLNEQYNNFGAKLDPKVEEYPDRTEYKWQFKDIPQIIPEPNMSAEVEINPTILLSTFNSWQDIYDWWWALAKDKIKASGEIKDKVKELIKDAQTPEQKTRAIYNFCAQKIRYVAVEYGQAGYEPHKAEEIYRNKYGDCKDQAILLVTMLKEAGITAWPVLIPTKEDYNLNEDFPAMLFNHCIAAASVQDKTIFLDATAETCSFGDLPADDEARQVLLCRPEGYKIEKTPLYGAEHNRVRQQLNMKVNADESINVEKSILVSGMYDQAQRYWFLYTPPEIIRQQLEEKIQDVSIGAKLDKYTIKNLDNLNEPVVLSYVFGGTEYFTDAGKLRIMPQLSGLDTSLVAKNARKYPIDFGVLDLKETAFEIELPPGFSVKYIPEGINEDSPWLKFSSEYKYNDKKIYFRQTIE